MMYFGYDWPSDLPRGEAPVGHYCARCEELVDEGESGVLMPYFDGEAYDSQVWHRECYLRTLFGSLGHQQRKCSCFGGTGEGDPEGMTKREAARAAVTHYMERSR